MCNFLLIFKVLKYLVNIIFALKKWYLILIMGYQSELFVDVYADRVSLNESVVI